MIVVYKASWWYRECGGQPLFSRAELARVKKWLAKRAQMEMA